MFFFRNILKNNIMSYLCQFQACNKSQYWSGPNVTGPHRKRSVSILTLDCIESTLTNGKEFPFPFSCSCSLSLSLAVFLLLSLAFSCSLSLALFLLLAFSLFLSKSERGRFFCFPAMNTHFITPWFIELNKMNKKPPEDF